jgi:hypothetical protein
MTPDALPAAGFVAVGLLLGLLAARYRVRRRVARHRAMGRRGQERAHGILTRAGYRVIGTEVTAVGQILVDGREAEFRIRADFIVRRWFRRYVAEVKGGTESADPANRATRRQLMEYAHVFNVHGVLLVDSEAGRVRRVEFPV